MADTARPSGPESDARHGHRSQGLLTKFLLILVPVFLILTLPGTWMIVAYNARDHSEEVAARLGGKAAQISAAMGRHDAASHPQLARDLMATMASERAFLCAELRDSDGLALAAYPPTLGCAGRTDGDSLSLPVGDKYKQTLFVRFTNASLEAGEHKLLAFWLGVLALSFVLALVVATVGFRLIVNRPLGLLLDAIQRAAETGTRAPVSVTTGDELGRVIAAYNEMVERDTRREAALAQAYEQLQASEAELKRLNDELEGRVRERTADLEMEKIRAESANMAKSRFLASMSHELRTPLNSIIGFAEILKSEALGDLGDTRYLEFSGNIYSSGQHLLQIINDILDISKIESGTMSLHEQEVDADEIIGETLRLVQPMCDAAAVNMRRPANRPEMRLHVDPTKIKQVLINLLANAVKFTPRGGTVNLSLSVDPDGRAAFQVVDTGIGMRKEDIPVALSAFGQVDDTKDGTGLGLPLAKRLMELHGGDLRIASEPGKGTRITVRLPKQRVRPLDAAVA